MDKYRSLLIEWCDALLRAQITDERNPYFGGFRCDACAFPHGRADNAIFPFVFAHSLTGETKYLTGAKRLLAFRKLLTEDTGAVHNDFSSEWRGITTFSAINLLKTLLYFGDKLPPDLKQEIEVCARSSAKWVHENVGIGFPAYVNYYCAASLVNALYAKLYLDAAYAARAKELLSYCLNLFTPNGLLAGEGKPHDARSPKGCLPIDIGYVAEESLPCLVHTASLLKEEGALTSLTENARKLLNFMLPDGGWDNSFGVRNNKWTYYGSRTSDGCIGAFAALATRDPLFQEATERTFEILRACTHDGKLYGGRYYPENGQPPCVHHTFCHAAALADAILEEIAEPQKRLSLPCDDRSVGFKFYPELNTYKIHAGEYLATVTGYDFATQHFTHGAAHASGGTISLLYKQGAGPILAGSVYEYERTEPNNMQAPAGETRHASMLLRAEYEKDGIKYATCLDPNAEITVYAERGAVTATVKARFRSVDGKEEEEMPLAEFYYKFEKDGVTLTVKKVREGVRLVLPLVRNASAIVTQSRFEKRPIFFLTGGFAAEEYAFPLAKKVTLRIK